MGLADPVPAEPGAGHLRFVAASGVGETPAFLQLEASKDVTQSPIREVFTQHMRPLLIAGGSRIGSDVLYALVVVFTLTYVTTVLNLPRPLALGATMLGR